MNTLHIKTGDQVMVLSGKDKGKKGKVLSVEPKKGQAVVEGVNVAARHVKPRRQGQAGGIIKQEIGIRACKLMRVCPKCNKPTRAAHTVMPDGARSRSCKQCGELI
ncbi:MAG: 50S ribosomal protein L24 [Oscillospiraceae bacterium]|nr:50S ribosomal protein L24 [Oscillospiraceae bacterium]